MGDSCFGCKTKSAGKDRNAWPFWQLVLIALPQLGVSMLWGFIMPTSVPYMLQLGMDPALATLNNLAGPVTALFTGPIVGAASDICTSTLGRRRPVILIGLVSTWVAGMFYAASGHLFTGRTALFVATPMYWVMDVTINILQTPHRALVADLASDEQQLPMQVVFVCMMAVGNFLAFSIMKVYTQLFEHMLELMFSMCVIATLCVGVQFLVVSEKPLARDQGAPAESMCTPIANIAKAVQGSPSLLYHLLVVQCFVWVGNTAWMSYAGQWFANSVYGGDQNSPDGSPEKLAYDQGMAAFSRGGQYRSILQLLSTLAIIAILVKTRLRPRSVYAPCILIGAVTSVLAFAAVGHLHTFALVCTAVSIMPVVGTFTIPFGLVGTLNRRAEMEGKQAETGLQMALLNCCCCVGQQLCTLALAALEERMPLKAALHYVFVLAAVAQGLGAVGAMFLDDNPGGDGPAYQTFINTGGDVERNVKQEA